MQENRDEKYIMSSSNSKSKQQITACITNINKVPPKEQWKNEAEYTRKSAQTYSDIMGEKAQVHIPMHRICK